MSQYSFESQAEADYRLQWPEENAPEIDEKEITWQTVYEQLQEIQEKIGNYIQHWWAIEWWWRKVYDPISLSRVLSALGSWFYYKYKFIYKIETYMENEYKLCERKLLNDDNSDCMLSDQSPETIKAIWEIVCK